MRFLIFFIAALFLVSFILLAGLAWSEGPLGKESIAQLGIAAHGGQVHTVNVYLALTPEEQDLGLMYQRSMGNCNGDGNCYGMLFVFPNYSDQCFWMKNTVMPLKQIWITGNSITSEVNASPYSTAAYCHYGNSVLEAYPNSSLQIGDEVTLEKVFR
jgi:uncharacterized membrane protein (UPF0127 family)